MDIKSLTPSPTGHFVKMMNEKDFSPTAIILTMRNPSEVYPSKSHPGQWRVTGNGVCIVGKPVDDKFVMITVYADRVVTPVRPDQLNTPEGRKFAQIGRQ